MAASAEASLSFSFEGTYLQLRPDRATSGTWSVALDGAGEKSVEVTSGAPVWLARRLARGQHTLTLRASSSRLSVDSLTVYNRSPLIPWLLGAAALLLVAAVARSLRPERRDPPKAGPFRRVQR